MAKDPGRQFLYEQIQHEGFNFLDNYLETFFEGPKKEPVIELLKTPGRKKSAPARNRSAVAAKAQFVTSMSFEDGDMKENRRPINDFHKTLLQVKEQDSPDKSTLTVTERHLAQDSGSLINSKKQRIITIADSPTVHTTETKSDMDQARNPTSALPLESGLSVVPTTRLSPELREAVKELSMIAEDDEPAERSRTSIHISPPVETHAMDINEPQDVFHDAATDLTDDVLMQDVHEEDTPAPEAEEPTHGNITSTSTPTFQSIPLSLPELDPEPPSARTADFHTAPLPKVSLPAVPMEEEPHSHTAPLPASSYQDEYTEPLRDEPSPPVLGLSRKHSTPQFAGLPAPSPLRKSLRVPSDAPLGPGSSTTAVPPTGKRTSTSWLSKARETTKAMETTAKRTSTLGLAAIMFSTNKRKSGEMLELARDSANAVLKSLEEEERAAKLPKLTAVADPVVDIKGKSKATINQDTPDENGRHQSVDVTGMNPAVSNAASDQDDSNMLTTLLKKNYGSRTGKSTGKSLGGTAAAALAEARAAAEARVAERHKLEMGIVAGAEDVSILQGASPAMSASVPPMESERRLSVSDLVPSSEGKPKAETKGGFALDKQRMPSGADISSSTTPPNSPPRVRTTSFVGHTGPVFTKPSAAPASGRPETATNAPRDFNLPTTNPFSIPAAMPLGKNKYALLSAQSSKTSVFSDIIFDQSNVSPAWMPSTQDTSYSAAQSQRSQPKDECNDNDDLEEDDSWGVDDKFAGVNMWTPFGFTSANPDQLKDDTMTWSTSRSTSQRDGDTGGLQATQSLFSPQRLVEDDEERGEPEPEPELNFAERLIGSHQLPDTEGGVHDEADMAMEIDEEDEPQTSDIEDVITAGKSTVKLVQKSDLPSQPRCDSQQSMASSSSSQSNLGIFGHASKLVSSILGGSKKAKPEVKSLQRAAVAKKKDQEEQEKKAARLKEMENRRQLAMQRKAEEERVRAQEEERKIREEAERRKREREEHTDKRPLRSTTSVAKKVEDDANKRKVATVVPPSQKPPSKDKKDNAAPRPVKPNTGGGGPATLKPILKSALKQPPSGSTVPITPGANKAPAPKSVKHAPSLSNLTVAAAIAKGKERDVPEQQVSHSHNTNRPAGPPPQEPRVASESIELPDINSEYSDSDDEDRPKRDLPDWAKSPDIAAALRQQSTINPDDIFGRVGPLRMEEIFRTRHSRFRARTSSANWTGTDELTATEEREYAKRMGFR